MKTTTYLKISLIALSGFGALTSCVQDDKFDTPAIQCSNQFAEANITIKDFKALAPTPVNFVSNYVVPNGTNDAPVIFEGYVVSSDEGGNFYKQLTIQDSPENPTAGIQVAINKTFLYTDYPVGSHVRVKANGLSVGIDRGVVKLGYVNPTGQIPEGNMRNFITGVCGGNTMDIKTITPRVVNSIADAMKDEYINTLVTIKNVQFAEADGKVTYADAVNNQTVDRTLVDKQDNSVIVRNSGFARFAGTTLPTKSGDITVVVSKYNSTWQFYIRDLNDVKFEQDRFVSAKNVLGGDAPVYSKSIAETFDNVTTATNFKRIADSKYINYSVLENRFWEQKAFSGNNYIQISSFKSNTNVNAYFIVPAEFTGTSKLSFQTKDGYYTGEALKVYYTTKYTPGGEVNKADLVDITSKFTFSKGNVNGYAVDWVNSGEFTIPITGKGYIIFEYAGTTTITTTMQLDNITLK
ncbi:DUF5689 domain-containing protein [Riemerella anatipestifer]|uniref:DUF5689 domain-containing protein n=1 Tax=Riemerella anatipestifer TaxID=34085 RepID=UPI0012AE9F04|nr:DUF5689 domain-containing protein [Riemerella anatipestifer]MCO7318422.1 DUF5689 domain-containing protein [Riemerella anatipestifer]MCQ4154704.1 DUF5689 domain-containing protein [Riemerella anatipestifer]MCQ4180709.1 DUF5689 domain-containing protein [Riemerella anatipestifer]MCW0473865.1 DUF5689 domain-containing protein [Riemerella anatipestifer]MDR7774712.1 DUF5689 domain-containing protein [Riemerella anatipestifer]